MQKCVIKSKFARQNVVLCENDAAKSSEDRVKRRMLCIAVAVLLVVLSAACLVACHKGAELPDAQPTVWETDLENAARKIAENIRLEGGSVNFTFNAVATDGQGGRTTLFAGMNYNLSDVDASLLCLEIKDEERTLVSLKSNNDTTYVDVVPNDYIGDVKLQVLNLNIFDLFNVEYNPVGQDGVIEAFEDILVNLGKTFFNGVNIEKDDTYVFDVNPAFAKQGGEYFAAVFAAFGDTFTSAVLGAFGIEDVTELFGLLPEMRGQVAFRFGGDGFSVFTRNFVFDGESAFLDAEFTVSDAADDTLWEMFPTDSSGYVQTKIGNSYMEGTVSLLDGDDRVMRYDYQLNANIDLLTLYLNDYDLTSLPEDNYLHFKVSHKCGSGCGEFCAEKTGASRGSVFEIGFSPFDFGTYNVYCSLNVQALLSQRYVEKLSADRGVSLAAAFPDYTLFAFPYQNVQGNSFLLKLLKLLYMDNLFNGESFGFSVDDCREMFGADTGIIGEIFGQFVEGEEYSVDAVRFDIQENLYGQALQYDVYKQTVYIIADDVPEVKDYGFDLPLLGYMYVVPLSWEYEDYARTSDGELLSNLYDWNGNMVHGVDANGNYVPLSPEEAQGLTEYYLHAEYVKYDKVTTEDFSARIISVEGLDLADREVQEITVTAEYPNPLYAGRINGSDDIADTFSVEVAVRIKLTDYGADGVEFLQDTEGKKFYLETSSATPPEFLKAQVRISYANGYVKTMDIIGSSDAVVFSNNILISLYSTVETGRISAEFSVANKKYVRYYDVEEPEEVTFTIKEDEIGPYNVGKTVYMSSLTQKVKMTASYDLGGGEKKTVDVLLRAGDFYINGIPLSSDSSDWDSVTISDYGSYTVTFRKANNYRCTVKKLGYESQVFVIPVLPVQSVAPTYRYEQTTASPQYWFVGADYTLRGTVSNLTHGETAAGETSYVFTFEIQKGTLVDNSASGGTSTVTFASGETKVDDDARRTLFCDAVTGETYASLRSFAVGAVSGYAAAVSVTLPDMIVSPVGVSYTFSFAQAGYYRVRMEGRSDEGGRTVAHTFDVYVGTI